MARAEIALLAPTLDGLAPTRVGAYRVRTLRERVHFVGLRYRHHAHSSGYEVFGHYVGSALRPPVDFRWTLGPRGYPWNQRLCRATRHPWYSIGAHLTEWAALGHMLRHRRRLYHVLYGDTDLWLLRRAHRLTGNRLVASFHQPTSDLRALGTIERVARHLDAVILVCEAQRAYFETFLPPERVVVVPHGVDSAFFHPPDRPPAEPTCVTVGAHLRDFETFRAAIALVWQARPEVRFVCVGTRRDPKFLFTGLEDPRVRYLDRVSDTDLRAAHHGAQLAVFAFQYTTANNAVLEAMASGLPVVATDVGGIRDYVDDRNGVLCPEKDPAALAAAMLRVLGDATERRRMAQASRMKALRLDYHLVAERLRAVYARLLGVSA